MQKFFHFGLVIFIFLMIYFIKEPIYAFFIKDDEALNMVLEEEKKENKRTTTEYEELLSYPLKEEGILSKIIYRDPLEYFSMVTILKGEDDNIKEGDTVFNEQGLIGIVKKTNKHSSIVNLLMNKETKIGAKINETYGVLESDGQNLIMKNLTNTTDIHENALVTTANFTSIVPDLNIGTVKEIRKTNQDLSVDVIINPSVDFNKIRYVTIKGSEAYE